MIAGAAPVDADAQPAAAADGEPPGVVTYRPRRERTNPSVIMENAWCGGRLQHDRGELWPARRWKQGGGERVVVKV
ncbi:hypothetical protein [Dactylosporangium sp. CA-092794]|uniref:hypothetical protein n=1 Tax=Dactylosporangium sp. CA-092794 TaxID=3239929 RepID=UPI003D91A140